jgi:hypothetical protein
MEFGLCDCLRRWDTVSGSASHWNAVNDPVGSPDNNSSYIQTATNGDYDVFGYSAFSVPAGATINSVSVIFVAADGNFNGNNRMEPVLRVGGTDYKNSSNYNPSNQQPTYDAPYTANWATNPATAAAWTVDDVNGIGANPLQGFGVNSEDSSPTLRVTQVYIEVDYTPCPDPDPSTITIPGGQSASGDPYDVSGMFNTTGDVGSIECKVTTGGAGAPFTDELEYFDTADVNNDWAFWTPSTGSPEANGNLGTWNTGTGSGQCTGGAGTSFTGSNNTGPCVKDSGAGFLYLEASGSGPYTVYFTRDVSFDASTYEPNISFKYNMNGADIISLTFQVNDGGGWTDEWVQTGPDGNNGSTWTEVDLNLFAGTVSIDGGASEPTSNYGGSDTAYTSGNLDYRFEFVSNSFEGDTAIDTIRVYGNAQVTETTCTDWTSSCNSIPASGAGAGACDPYTDGGTYTLDVRGTDPDCGDPVTTTATDFTWNAAACNRVDPTVSIQAPLALDIIAGNGTADYTVSITNNDNGGGCGTM